MSRLRGQCYDSIVLKISFMYSSGLYGRVVIVSNGGRKHCHVEMNFDAAVDSIVLTHNTRQLFGLPTSCLKFVHFCRDAALVQYSIVVQSLE